MATVPLRYYLPRPLLDHRRALLPWVSEGRPLIECLRGHGPDADGAGGGGGLCIGGAYRADEAGWQQAPEGWWLHPGDATPDDLVRLALIPGTSVRVPGALPNHAWSVPVLAVRVENLWQSALPPVLGPAGWECPRPYAAITRLLICALERAPEATEDDLPALTALAADLLALHYEIALPPLRLLGWLGLAMVPAILRAAAGLPPEDA